MTRSGSDEALRSYYAARAHEYDRIYRKPERQADLRAIEQWLPPRLAGKRALEVACGTGYWTQFLAAVASELVAIDAAPETLAIASARVAGQEVAFLVADAYDLPPLPAFEAAFAGFWFSHVPTSRRRAFLAGLRGRLVPGAPVILLDNRYVEGSSTPLAEWDHEGNSYQRRALDDGSTHRVLKNFPSETELTQAIAGLGTQPAFTVWDHYWAFEYRAA